MDPAPTTSSSNLAKSVAIPVGIVVAVLALLSFGLWRVSKMPKFSGLASKLSFGRFGGKPAGTGGRPLFTLNGVAAHADEAGKIYDYGQQIYNGLQNGNSGQTSSSPNSVYNYT